MGTSGNQWLPLFTRPATVNIVLESWRFLQRDSGLQLYGYVILENHLHLIAASPDLSKDIQRFKAYTAKQIIAYLQQSGSERVLALLALLKRPHKTESEYQVWEEGSHPPRIDSETVMRQKLDYIHRNPVQARLCGLAGALALFQRAELCGVGGLIDVTREAKASEGGDPTPSGSLETSVIASPT